MTEISPISGLLEKYQTYKLIQPAIHIYPRPGLIMVMFRSRKRLVPSPEIGMKCWLTAFQNERDGISGFM